MTIDRPQANGSDPLSAVRADHGCFGCGDRNPIGLQLRFTTTPKGVAAPFVPLVEHQGFEDVIHGGIISAVLDEAMAWATAAEGIWAVTAEMRVRFRNPLRVGQVTIVSASIDSRRGRMVAVSAMLTLDLDGSPIATANGAFMRVDTSTEERWRARYLSPGS